MVALTRDRRAGVEGRLRSSRRAPCNHLPPCGCEIASKHLEGVSCCLRCPFESCVFDIDHYERKTLTSLKVETVAFLFDEGISIQYIADRMGMSKRNTYKLHSMYKGSNGS